MGETPTGHDVFDVRRVRRLVQLMNEHELSEIDLRHGDMRIRIRRGEQTVISPLPAGPAYSPGAYPVSQPAEAAPGAAPSASAAAEQSPPPEPPTEEENLELIRSPLVGTFYAAPDPDSPSYVSVGDMVAPDTVVCIVEAMKVFNEIPAEIAGKIVAVLVENGEPVEYGQPLFKVDTTV